MGCEVAASAWGPMKSLIALAMNLSLRALVSSWRTSAAPAYWLSSWKRGMTACSWLCRSWTSF